MIVIVVVIGFERGGDDNLASEARRCASAPRPAFRHASSSSNDPNTRRPTCSRRRGVGRGTLRHAACGAKPAPARRPRRSNSPPAPRRPPAVGQKDASVETFESASAWAQSAEERFIWWETEIAVNRRPSKPTLSNKGGGISRKPSNPALNRVRRLLAQLLARIALLPAAPLATIPPAPGSGFAIAGAIFDRSRRNEPGVTL